MAKMALCGLSAARAGFCWMGRPHSIPTASPQRPQSPAGPLIPHHVLIKMVELSSTSCCHLGFSQRWNEMSVHVQVHVCPLVSSSPPPPPSLLPLLPPSPPRPQTRQSAASSARLRAHVRGAPPTRSNLPTSKLPVNAPRSGSEHAHVHVPTFPCCAHVRANAL